MGEKAATSAEKSAFEYQFELLKSELDLVDSTIRQHDEITKSIKNWAIVTWTASIGVCLSQAPLTKYLWLTATIAFLFWIVDALFRRIQKTFIERTEEISSYINSAEFKSAAASGNPMDFQLMKMRVRPKHWWRSYFAIFRYFSVAVLYAGLAGLSILVWLFVGV